jgi:hypothetical protein
VELPPWCFEFATAWIITKTTEPARLMAALALVPFLVKRAPLPFLRLFVPPLRWPGVLAQRAGGRTRFAAGAGAGRNASAEGATEAAACAERRRFASSKLTSRLTPARTSRR